MSKQPESFYNLNKLHFIAALAVIGLLMALGALFMKDYDREWKKYQKEFREYEIINTRIKNDLAVKDLQKNPEYKEITDKLKEAKANYAQNCPDEKALLSELAKLNSLDAIINQNYKFKKTELDVAKFNFEEAQAHGHPGTDFDVLKTQYLKFDEETRALKLSVEESASKVKVVQSKIDSCSAQIKELTRQELALSKPASLPERKLNKIDPNQMSFINQIANLVRDMPILDLSNPNYKVDQIVLNEITDDVNFKLVPKVDRCTTCHLGIANPDYKNAPQPFTTHPNLELFIGNNSKHPIEEFGCTVCHGGRGRGTSFVSAGHTPSSEEQKKEWQKKYNWHELHLWEEPILPKQYVEAGCFKCHSGQTTIKGAEKLNLGLNLIERAGCFGCHTIEKYQGWPKTGPDLTHLAAKSSKDWAYKWIIDPHQFRHNTWMPAFFNQSNNSDPDSVARNEQEVHAMVEFLYAKPTTYKTNKSEFTSDAKRGEELVASLGCFACHQVQKEPDNAPTTRTTLSQQQGPNLISLGSKTSREWLISWLKNPNEYHPETKMPNMRLSDQEAADIAEYLVSDKDTAYDQKPLPPINEKIINQIASDFLTKIESTQSATNKLAKMSLNEKMIFAGEKLISKYGCYACHNIPGFENQKPIGTELTEQGSKSIHKLDFGFVHIDHTKEAWFKQKLLNPRIYDKNKIRSHEEKLLMPNFNFTEDEAEAITTALLGFTKDKHVQAKKKPRTPENLFIEEGQKIIRQLNCQACHIIEDEGGAISQSVKDWLIKYDNRAESEAAAMIVSFSPPNLIGEGKKVNTEWLFDFLHKPTTIRPWLKVRMPTYEFNAAHLNAVVQYFSTLDKENFPFTDKVDVSLTPEEYTAAEKLFSTDYFGCAQCHIVGDQMPTGSPDSWAPNFALAKSRLKPEWIIEWMKNPAALLPGTKMPTYFDPGSFDASGPEDLLNGDENLQIRALRNYLMTLSDGHAAPAQKTETSPDPAVDSAIPAKADNGKK